MPIRRGVVQRNEPALVLGVHVRPVFQQILGHVQIVVTGRQVERSRISTLSKTKVDQNGHTRTIPTGFIHSSIGFHLRCDLIRNICRLRDLQS